MNQDPELRRYQYILILCVVISLLTAIVSAYFKSWEHAGKGGAVGVAISFSMLFATKSYGSKFYDTFEKEMTATRNEILNVTGGKEDNLAIIENKLNAIIGKIGIDEASHKRQNRFLVWSSVVSTLFWGFGDVFAKTLRYVFLLFL